MNNLTNSKSSKHCGNSTDLQKQTATPFVPSMSISTHLKGCKVALEDISFSCGAAKFQMLDLSQDKTHMTDSHHTTESDFLKNLCLKTPIAWVTQLMNDGHNWMIKLVTNFICALR